MPYGYTYEILDSTKNEKPAFCFYDGKDVYVKMDDITWNYGIFYRDRGGFFKMNKLGSYPYFFMRKGFSSVIVFFLPASVAATVATIIVNSAITAKAVLDVNKLDIFFYNKNTNY